MTEAAATLLGQMRLEEDFETGAGYLSGFFRRTEERWDAGDVLEGLFSPDADRKAVEYALFCFFHVGRADLDTAASAMKLRRLSALLRRALRFPHALSERERAVVARMRAGAGLQNMAHFCKLRADANAWISAMFARQTVHPRCRTLIALLIECEAAALTQRLNFVSDRIDPYDLKAMSKILPLVTIFEERARAYRLLAETIGAGGEIGKSVLSFEYLMKEDDFGKWFKRVAKKDSLKKFVSALAAQREKKIPARALVGISSLTRLALGDESAPLDWIARALECGGSLRFSVDCGSMAPQAARMLAGSTIIIDGATARGDYARETFANLTGADMLTTPARRPEPDVYDLACRAMNNESILTRLLDNPLAYNRPGLVERVATASRSLNVLTKIASTRELYTGGANTGVPAALLRNPCAIPMSLLRGFVNPMYVPVADLREIARGGRNIRREVLSEVENYMKRRG